ncbi:hypothetical protein Emin_0246 [Elusimicrobium minutum Pei191]|uniref:Uncharacterized protein n=1 Tax=Elusimicrobium minutum (strain Pei191) TaxID=445932 RepID=B2KB49_ELUMP|nr:hypothetical protein Emin_0246 [Elusimicrobium minutum Pei191]
MILENGSDTPRLQGTFRMLCKTSVTQTMVRSVDIKDASLYAGHASKQVTEDIIYPKK